VELNSEGFFFSSGYQKLFILLVFAALIAAEKYRKRRTNDTNVVRRSYWLNIKITVFNDVIMNLLSVSTLLLAADGLSDFGLLNLIPSVSLKLFLSFVLYDLMLYWFHRIRHGYKFLWQFHKVHHSDFDLNVTTTFRLHIAEVILMTAVKMAFIVIMGIPMAIFAANELLITTIVMASHANISFRGEKTLAFIFVMPCVHLVHHSMYWKEHESNFGFALSVWDRLFGTCQCTEPERIGLPGMKEPNFRETLFLTFKNKGSPGQSPEVLRELASLVQKRDKTSRY
jgi:sterol desaturase/sphingolipid hydroxylase (fatty acid hydroxylase superfamily)